MFQALIAIILEYEGPLYDPSGPSKYGINRHMLSIYRNREIFDNDIRTLTESEAKEIYKKYFFKSWMNNLEPSIALVVLDTLIHHGEGKGTKLIQKSINDPEIKRDGILGPKTQKYLGEVGNTFIKRLLSLRYIALTKNPRNETKMRGLTNRLINLAVDSQNLEIKDGNNRSDIEPDSDNYKRDSIHGTDPDPLG